MIHINEGFVPVSYETKQERTFVESVLKPLNCKHINISSQGEKGMILMDRTCIPQLRKALEKLDALQSPGGS